MMMSNNSSGNGRQQQLTVPPGFRFHPTDEELLYYYLRKKVSYQPIDLDVIREIDLNKLEPWDLKDKCGIGSGPQTEWYFFSHKDKKYPTGSRTNRATTAGFWKATGRDKPIHHHIDTDTGAAKRIGMRKTLVFYTGRAPHGHKTDWIMHEYRLHHDLMDPDHMHLEEGWVICRVFKKKAHTRGFHPYQDDLHLTSSYDALISSTTVDHHHRHSTTSIPNNLPNYLNNFTSFDQINNSSMHLPQLLSPDLPNVNIPPTPPLILTSDSTMDLQHNNPLRLLQSSAGSTATGLDKLSRDWSFLDKLLAGHHQAAGSMQDQIGKCASLPQLNKYLVAPQPQRFLPFPNNCNSLEPDDFSRFPN